MKNSVPTVLMFSMKIHRVSSPAEITENILGRPLPYEPVKYFLFYLLRSAAHQAINIDTSLSIWYLITPW